MNFIFAIAASLLVSALSLVGISTFLLKEKHFQKILIFLISFAAGGLIGGAFLHLLPEALERSRDNVLAPFSITILGFILFFILERYFHWRHCHDGVCDVHAFSYLNLIGDGIHNLIDGIIIGTSFAVNIRLGIVMTLAIILHEIPQEWGDFAVLVYGGFSKTKALFYNYLSGLAAILGTVLAFFFSSRVAHATAFLLPFAAGGFIYIAGCDLIPELHKAASSGKTSSSFIFFIAGILLMFLAKIALPNH